MNFSTRRPLLWPGLICGCLLFALVLFACHVFSGGGANTNPSPSGSRSVSTNPTSSGEGSASTNPMSSGSSNTNANSPSDGNGGENTNPVPPVPAWKVYTSYGYSIEYPKDWIYKIEKRETKRHTTIITTTFSDVHRVYALAIGVLPNTNGHLATQTPLGGALEGFKSAVTNYQELAIAPQATVSQQIWDQVAASGNLARLQGPVNTEEIAIACNYPVASASTKLYYIIYSGPSQTFDAANRVIFQPMLASFAFS